MPDTNPLAAKTSYIRPEIPDAGLSLIVQPTYDYVNTFPPQAKIDNNGQTPSGGSLFDEDYLKEVNDRRKLLGAAPLAPGGEASYNEAKRYNDQKLGFVAGRDNEDLYASKQGIFSSIGHGLGRLAALSVTKTGTGLGYLAGLVGIGNDSERYGHDFGAWIAGAGDNGIAKWFDMIENEKVKNDWFPIYKKATEKDHGFFRHMGDLDFWTDDVTDGAAFMISSFVPGMAIGKLNLGEKTMASLAKFRGLTAASEAEALSTEGVSGTVESQNLEREGLGAKLEQPKSTPTVQATPSATQEIPRVLGWIDNAKAARAVNTASVSIINTASQSMISANNAKNQAYETLINAKDANGNNKYEVDQALKISAKVAKDSYLMNLGALGVMNLWEANLIFKGASNSNKLIPGNKFNVSGIFGDAELAKKTIGQRVFHAFNEPVKGVLTGGVWLGNMQLAIDRLNSNSDNFDTDFGDKLKDLASQYGKQLKDAFTGNDPEASKSLGIGGLLGAAAGKLLGEDRQSEARKNLSSLNSQISAFRDLGNIYKTDSDNNMILENGSPVIDDNKINSWVASLNKVLNLQQVSKNFGKRGVEPMARLYQDEVFAKFAKAHFDAGLGDLLYQKLGDLKNVSKSDLALLGFDPDSQNGESSAQIDRLMKKGVELEDLYNNIQNNFVPKDVKLNTQSGREKYHKMADKLFYLSARAQAIQDRISESVTKYAKVSEDMEAYNTNYNKETDNTVTKYNEFFEKLQASKRRQRDIDSEIEYEQRQFSNLNQGEAPELQLPDQFRKEIYAKSDDQIAEAEKNLNEYTNENKEVLERLKKDANGRYLFEVANKNLLPAAKEIEQQQIVQAELGLAHNATMNVVSRLADPVYGEKYYDQVYSKEMERQAANIQDEDVTSFPGSSTQSEEDTNNLPKPDKRHFKTNISEEDVHNALEQGKEDPNAITNVKELSEHLAEKIANGESLTDEEKELQKLINEQVNDKLTERSEAKGLGDTFGKLSDLRRERDALEGQEDLSLEDEKKLSELNEQIDNLEEQRDDAFERNSNEMKVDGSQNIKPENKDLVKNILNKISSLRKRVKKFDNYYEVDGKRYRKVSDVIGDSISDEQRRDPATQAAVSAGNTIDRLVKAYFANDLTSDFKDGIASSISQEAYDHTIKTLDKVKNDLQAKGIEIIGSNIIMTDDDAKVAGEIDLLGVDKDGNFKIFEITGRRPDVYRQYGKRGLGVKIRDLDSKRLSLYRNIFANQYGVVPDDISVKFPFELRYDRGNPSGFIEDTKLRAPIRFTPVKNVEIKMKAPEPIRVGSKFNSLDMTRIFLDTFLKDKEAKGKLQYIFRNVPFKQMLSGIKLIVRPSEGDFQDRYNLQKRALNGDETVNYKINKFRDFRSKDEFGNPGEFKNLYSLVGNTEASLSYEGQPVGYLSPIQTLAYKDADGKFQILDENTDANTYAEVTGNDLSTYGEFRRVAAAYKKLHTELTNRLLANGGKSVTLNAEDLKDLADLKISYGELDLVKGKENRPDLKDLKFPGVKMGNRYVPTVINVDENDNVKVLMDKSRKGKNTFTKYQAVDKWANANLDRIVDAMTEKDSGRRLTDNVAVIETPDGDFKVISLRTKEGVDLSKEDDFVEDLGSKVTAATNKNIFKNEGIMLVPKETDQKINIGLKEHSVLSQIYKGDDVDTLEKAPNVPPVEEVHIDTVGQQVDDFLNDADEDLKQDLEDMHLNDKEAILNDYQNGDWSSMEDYLSDLKNCK